VIGQISAMNQKPADLSNWRTAPPNRWSFAHVDELIKTAAIARGPAALMPQGEALELRTVKLAAGSVAELLEETSTDGFLVLHRGKIVAETYPNMSAGTRHILFSVSKSMTGTLAGILVEEGKLDPHAPVVQYLPEVKHSAYRDAAVRHVLDMTVDLDFVENYLDAKGDFARYRVSTGWNPPNPELGSEGLHAFLATVKPAQSRHGEKFYYASPSSDLLGWLLERVGGMPFAQLLSEKLWQPLGAEADAFITVDAKGGARTAGGINTTLRDLARFGELMRNGGRAAARQIVPQSWVTDIRENGSREAWARGAMTHLFPHGSYRAKWYKANDEAGSFYAIGIHGQWIYVNPKAEVTAVKFSSQPDPVNDALDLRTLEAFVTIAQALT
jgi:CubicO group peptidase (beta-lactamase class C family)